MANFVLTNTVPPMYPGGPNNRCAVCQFDHTYPWYLVFEGVKAEQPIPTFNGQWTEIDVVLCSQHATELKAKLDEALPDDRLAKAQGRILQAEAARARAEKRADAAEKALHAMQDWQSEIPQVLSPGGK